ncbi:steroidogenic acute regulatory protein, mitochondrial-like [Neopelma chrysocephalum]|uniref:steroidogenic acute regulatory protein, mitochondrial-like n=1 Tax=Neopelma chrysocephalum TaxID=114329 RepID=UPI000FCD21B0|nr:steroidogenic acute regulatory protein, mitochondrial-like [Neopelma chrysocephalum]
MQRVPGGIPAPAMLQATVKLCCGIAHDPLRRLPGLKTAAVAAIQKDIRGLVARGSHHLPSKIPHYFQKLMGKDTAPCPEPTRDVSPSQSSSLDLSYIRQGERALQQALSILQQHTSWQAEPVLAEVVLTVPVAQLHQELFERMEQMPQWNPNLSQVKVLRRVGTDTLVTHEVTTPSPGNLVGQRDFVSVRHRGRRDAAIYLVGTATHAEPPPPQEGCIRAESRLSCIVLQPLAGDPGRTHLTWLLSMDLKGWIPAAVLHRVLPQSQADFLEHLRRHLCATAGP